MACSLQSYCFQSGKDYVDEGLIGGQTYEEKEEKTVIGSDDNSRHFETGIQKTIVHDGKEYTLGTIVDPVKLIERL